MIIVPELKKVFILVPRTGSGTLYREILRVYPKSMLLYRHMEADGCPRAYDRWERIGFVRHPVCRLQSLYTFMQSFSGGAQVQGGAASFDAERVRRQVNRPFEDWLLNNNEPWTVPYDLNGENAWWPVLARMNSAPENKTSQFVYLRPDLGVKVLKFENLHTHMHEWGLDPSRVTNASKKLVEILSEKAKNHIARFCSWDMEQNCEQI